MDSHCARSRLDLVQLVPQLDPQARDLYREGRGLVRVLLHDCTASVE